MRILYATDGSEQALCGSQLLGALCLSARDTVLTLSVATGEDTVAAEEAVAATLAALPAGPNVVSTVIQREHVADEIVLAAEKLDAELILMGARGHSGLAGLLLGSVSDRVLRRAHCPVLLARPVSNGLRRLIIGVDESPGAAAATEFVKMLPIPNSCEVRLLTLLPNLDQLESEHVIVTPPLCDSPTPLADLQRESARQHLESLASYFAVQGNTVTTLVRGGDPAEGLAFAARDEGADLLVIGSHGRGPVERFFLGSTSENVAHQAGCSVLVVRPG